MGDQLLWSAADLMIKKTASNAIERLVVLEVQKHLKTII